MRQVWKQSIMKLQKTPSWEVDSELNYKEAFGFVRHLSSIAEAPGHTKNVILHYSQSQLVRLSSVTILCMWRWWDHVQQKTLL